MRKMYRNSEDRPKGPSPYFQRLLDRRAALLEERPGLLQEIDIARQQGDLSENAEYQMGKERLREIDREISRLTQEIEEGPAKVTPQMEALNGLTVVLDDLDTKTTKVYHLVSGENPEVQPDPLNCIIAITSPLAVALSKRLPLEPGKLVQMPLRITMGGELAAERYFVPIERTFRIAQVIRTSGAAAPVEKPLLDYFKGGEEFSTRMFMRLSPEEQERAYADRIAYLELARMDSDVKDRLRQEADVAYGTAKGVRQNRGGRRLRRNPVEDVTVQLLAREYGSRPAKQRAALRRDIEALMLGFGSENIRGELADLSHDNLERLLYLLTAMG